MACCCNTLHLKSYNTVILVYLLFFFHTYCLYFYLFLFFIFTFESRRMVLFGAAWGASRQRDALRPGLNVCVCLPLSPVVQSLLRESQVIRQTKEKQISELKKMSDQSAESLKNEWEKKVRKGWKGSGFHRPVPLAARALNTEHSVSLELSQSRLSLRKNPKNPSSLSRCTVDVYVYCRNRKEKTFLFFLFFLENPAQPLYRLLVEGYLASGFIKHSLCSLFLNIIFCRPHVQSPTIRMARLQREIVLCSLIICFYVSQS